MAVPPKAIQFTDQNGDVVAHDPYDRVDYLLNLDGITGILENGEAVASYTISVTAEAAALGLTVSTGAWAPSQPSGAQILFWLEVDSGFQSNAAFDGEGVDLGVEISVTSDSVPARRRQRTCAIRVAQQ